MFEEAIRAMREGNPAAAEAAAEAALSENPQATDALYVKGLVRLGMGDHDAAREAFERAIAVSPDRADIHMALASLSVSAGRLEEAERASTIATEVDPNHLPAYVSLAQIHMAKGDVDAAQRFVTLASRVAQEHPQSLLVAGQLAHMKGDQQAALASLNRAANLAPDDVAVLTTLGLVYLAAGHAAFAEQALRRAIEHNPESSRSRWALVSALRAQGRLREALEALDAVAGGRRDGWVLAQRSTLLLEIGRDDEALADYRDLLDSASLHPRVLNSVVAGMLSRGRPDFAGRLVDALLAQRPGNEDLWRQRVRIAAETGEPVGDVVANWLAATPDSAEALQLQAMWLESRGELAAAEKSADHALASGARMHAAEMVKLRAEVRRSPEDACERADRLLSTSESAPFRRELYRLKGLANAMKGDANRAVEEWTRMLGEAIPGMAPPRPPSELESSPIATVRDPSTHAATPLLLWGAPGSDVPELARWIASSTGRAVHGDRFGAPPRLDGFEPRARGSSEAGRGPASWEEAFRAAGHQPEEDLDWLPNWDRSIDHDLPGARLVACVRDPRDMLLNWWVFGGFPSFRFPGPDEAAKWLRRSLGDLVERQRSAPGETMIIRMDAPLEQPGVDAALEMLGASPASGDRGSWGLTGFPARSWERYHGPLGTAFSQLEPVAKALGY